MNYKSHHFEIISNNKMRDFNLGLLYYKYMHPIENDNDKKKFLDNFAQISKNGNISRLSIRRNTLKSEADVAVAMTNQSRFLCGIGYQSRLEWGFSFDWTTGIPYLPGSSFKGALLSYLEFAVGETVENWHGKKAVLENGDEWTKKDVIKVFGPQGEKEEKKVGGVVFVDVYPENFKGFEVDIITPHYQPYYKDPKNNPPADIYNPVPIPFLTIAPGSRFLFLVKFRGQVNKADKNKLENLIKECGKNFGFGAKTATGYGYFI